MHDEVKLAPFGFDLGKGRINGSGVGDIAINQRVHTELLGQRTNAFFEGFAHVGKRQFSTGIGTGFGDAPSDGLVVGQPHNKAAFARHELI